MLHFSSGGVDIAFIDMAAQPREGVVERERPPVLLIHGFASNHAVNWINTLWVKALTGAGFRTIAFDNRGHGQSGKLYDPQDYTTENMARDAVNLLDHLGIERAVVQGYSMGARIASFVGRDDPARVAAMALGGLGDRLLKPAGLPSGIAEALEAPSIADVRESMPRMFRAFAEQTKSDLRALAACIRGSRQHLSVEAAAAITCPVLVCVGTMDLVSGNGEVLARHFPHGEFFEIDKRDHNQAVGDRHHRAAVLAFLARLEAEELW